ncbi:MAG: hypothetical protein U0791_27535 [Gemmataceae bacterium]
MAAKVRTLIASFVLAGGSSAAAQQPPAPFPVPAQEEPIEIFYGTTRVTPERAPESAAVVPASAVEESPKAVHSFVEAMASVRDGSRDITSAAVGLLGKVGERVKHTADTRPIIINAYPAPATQTMTAPAAPPQVVVVREPAESRHAEPAPAAVRLDVLLACGIGLAAVGVGAWAALRRTRHPLQSAGLAPAPLPLDPNSVSLMGKYNAGPKREAAEKFDLGPTYHEELQQKELVIEANNTAAVEFILSQNLALLAELNPGSEGEIVQTDGEGFAVPAVA